MRFIDLHADGFGKMVNKDVSFEDKINVIYGQNEAGKSTMHAYIRAMLFGIKRAKGVAAQTDTWSHYKPWKSQKYGGTLRIEEGGHIYRLTRDFYEAPMDVTVFDETSGETIENPDEWLKGVLCNMTLKSYDNTISIGQLKSSTDASMAEEIKAFLVNANTTGNSALNCEKAKEFLNAQKADLAAQLSPEATRKFAVNSGEIKKIEQEIKNPDILTKADDFQKELESLEQETQLNSKEMSDLNDAISAEKQELIDSSFNSSAEVTKSKEKFKQVCDDYFEATKNCNIFKLRTIWIVFLAFAILCGIIAVIAAVFKNNNAVTLIFGIKPSNLLLISVIAYIIFILLAIFFYLKCSAEKNKVEASAGMLASALRYYGAKDDFSQESINQVNDYLDHLNTVAISVEEKETELDRIRSEQELIVNKKSETMDNIDETRNVQDLLGDKVKRLRELYLENDGLQEAIAANEKITSDMDAIDMALATIDDISKDYQNSVGMYLNGEVSKYIEQITNGAYNSVSIDDNLDVFLNTEDRIVPVESVSSGTSDQIYLALRLASARIFQNNEYKLPLIFDDSLVNYDAKRLEAALRWIAETYKNQILIFSCHKREASILEEQGIDFNKIEL